MALSHPIHLSTGHSSPRTPSRLASPRRGPPRATPRPSPVSPHKRASFFRSTSLLAGLRLIRGSIQPISRSSYRLKWRRWRSFVRRWHGCRDISPILDDVPLRERLEIVISWAAYLQRRYHLCASTILYHLSAVKWHFGQLFGDTTLFEHRTIKALRIGLVLQERSQLCPSKGKLPTTMEMCRSIWIASRTTSATLHQRMVGFAQCLSFLLMLRASEYTRTAPNSPSDNPPPSSPRRPRRSPINDHAIRAKSVEFTCDLPGRSGAVLTAATLHHQQHQSIPWSSVRSVRLLFPGCKRDQQRRGTVYVFDSEDYPESSPEFVNIPWLCFHWTRTTSFSSPNDLFFSYPEPLLLPSPVLLRRSLRPSDICVTLRDAAEAAGFDRVSCLRFSAHSNRYGGACAARNAGASDSTIMFMGKWKSLSTSLDYQAAARGTMHAVSRLHQTPDFQSGFTSTDVRALNTRPDDFNSQYRRPRAAKTTPFRHPPSQARRGRGL